MCFLKFLNYSVKLNLRELAQNNGNITAITVLFYIWISNFHTGNFIQKGSFLIIVCPFFHYNIISVVPPYGVCIYKLVCYARFYCDVLLNYWIRYTNVTIKFSCTGRSVIINAISHHNITAMLFIKIVNLETFPWFFF